MTASPPETSMVERVARAIHSTHATTPWPADDCATCEKLARAAIAAMREPTEAMIEKIVRADFLRHSVWDGYNAEVKNSEWLRMKNIEIEQFKRRWAAAIDAVLSDKLNAALEGK